MLGDILRDKARQYVAKRDEKTGTWRIYNLWHPGMSASSLDDDIPDDSQAVTILTEDQFSVVLEEASRLKIIQSFAKNLQQQEMEDLKSEIEKKDQEILSLKKPHNEKPLRSEGFELKSKAMDQILKLAALGEIGDMKE